VLCFVARYTCFCCLLFLITKFFDQKCGLYEECIKIARALNDREKIMDSRLLARANKSGGAEKNDDDLEKAMKSMLHL
jgi:hypothetical protein